MESSNERGTLVLFVTGSFRCPRALWGFHDVARHGCKAQVGDLAEAGWVIWVAHPTSTLGHMCQCWAEICTSPHAHDGEGLPEGCLAWAPIHRLCLCLPGCLFSAL